MEIIIIEDKSTISHKFSEILNENGFKVSYVKLEEIENENKMLAKLKLADVIINTSYNKVLEKKISHSKKYLEDFTKLISIIKKLNKKPKAFIATSFTSIYSNDGIQTEMNISYSNNYISNLAIPMEEQVSSLQEHGIRPIIMRLPLVVDNEGFLKRIKTIYKFKIRLKDIKANKFITWVSTQDIARALIFIINDEKRSGVFNIVSPKIAKTKEVTDALKKKFGKSFTSLSTNIGRRFLKNYIDLFENLKVQPKRLLDEGFEFEDKALGSFIDKSLQELEDKQKSLIQVANNA